MFSYLITLYFAVCTLFTTPASFHIDAGITGTWTGKVNGITHLLLVQDGYLSYTAFDEQNKKFFYSKGGGYTMSGDTIMVKCEFNSADKAQVGKTVPFAITQNKTVRVFEENVPLQFKDSPTTPLTGTWRINGRMNDGKLSGMPLRPRRTLKILTGTHFQWLAINVETGEFSATGGGEYTFKNGQYTESIHFFSRDSSRIGMQLSFKGEIKDGLWHHSGKSSKGDPIHETWERYVAGAN